MLVSELRNLLKRYNEDDLRVIIAEMYKSMPKKLRKEKAIDSLLEDFEKNMNAKKESKNRVQPVDLDDIKVEIELFLENAYEGNYFKPNKMVHKNERPKWRFKVKSYIKSLETIPHGSCHGEEATELLAKLFKMLNHACRYTLFNTQDPYNSAKIDQEDLLKVILIRKLDRGLNYESVKYVVELVLNSESNHTSLLTSSKAILKTADAKEMALKASLELKKDMFLSSGTFENKKYVKSMDWYYKDKKINKLVELIVKLKLSLYDYDEAIIYFHRHYKENNKEIILYVLLRILLAYDLKDYWIREYEVAIKKDIEPRKLLKEKYAYIKENDELPKS